MLKSSDSQLSQSKHCGRVFGIQKNKWAREGSIQRKKLLILNASSERANTV